MPASLLSPLSRPVLDVLMEHLPVGLMITSAKNLEVIAISEQACSLLGRARDDLEHKSIASIASQFKVISREGEIARESQYPIVRTCTTGEVVKGEEWSVEDKDGKRTTMLVNAAPIRGEGGDIVGGLVCWTDITSLKAVEQRLREYAATETILLRESNHRIKNHLQMLAGLVEMEARRPGITARELATSMGERLSVLAAAHEGFYSSGHAGSVNAAQLVEWVARALDSPQHPIAIRCPTDLDFGDSQVTPVALAINEAVSNALKHAFPGGRPGGITVSIERDAGMVVLDIADEGKGLPEQGVGGGHGTQILGVLARQLDGSLSFQNRPKGGAVVRLRFPEASPRGCFSPSPS